MPVIFIMSAIVSGIALCMLTYIVIMEWKKLRARRGAARYESLKGAQLELVRKTSRYLVLFMLFAISLELLDLVFRGYTAVKHWDILRVVIYQKDFSNIFIKQYFLGNLVPFALLLWPRLGIRRAVLALVLVLFGVYMMRWNVVIGGQSFSLSLSGFMHYHIPLLPHDYETFKEGLLGALTIGAMPFALFWIINKITPSVPELRE